VLAPLLPLVAWGGLVTTAVMPWASTSNTTGCDDGVVQDGFTALVLACRNGQTNTARWLISDANSDARTERDNVSRRHVSCRVVLLDPRWASLVRLIVARACGCVARTVSQPCCGPATTVISTLHAGSSWRWAATPKVRETTYVRGRLVND
jgi:hypothetical protein